MNDNRPPEVHAFYSDPPDRIAFQAYMGVEDNGEIARLAAMMAPKWKTFDPVALVDAAMALQVETEAGLIRRREAMAETMNFATLLALQQELGMTPIPQVKGDKRIHDPILGPILRKLDSVLSAGLEQGTARIAGELAAAAERTKLPRPALPCGIKDALRFVTDSPDVPWHILKEAFMDYLGVSKISGQMASINKRVEDLTNQIGQTEQALAKLKRDKRKGPQNNTSKRKLEEKLKSLGDDLAPQRSLRNYFELFTPGMVMPATLEAELSASYAQYMQGPIDEPALAILATGFPQFFQERRAAYLKYHASPEKARKAEAKKAKAAKNREAAPKGPASRERNEWLGQTGAFVAFLKANPQPSSDISESIKTFAHDHCKRSTPRAKSKVWSFLGTLALYLDRDFDTDGILRPLRKCGINALTEDAVRECLDLMKSAIGRGR